MQTHPGFRGRRRSRKQHLRECHVPVQIIAVADVPPLQFSGIKKKGDVQCQVYTRDDCKNKDDSFTSGEFDHPYWFGSEWDTAVAKSYKCRSK